MLHGVGCLDSNRYRLGPWNVLWRLYIIADLDTKLFKIGLMNHRQGGLMYRLLLVLSFLSFSVQAHCSESQAEHIYYTLVKPGVFDVVYHRVDPAGAGSAAAGLLGAAIQTSHQNSKDEEKQSLLQPHVSIDNCGDILIQAFQDKITKKQLPASLIESSKELDKGSLVLEISVDGCGFRLTDSVGGLMSSHLLGKMRLTRKGESKPVLEERIFVTGKQQLTFNELLREPELLDPYLEAVLKKAGKRIANKVIYL
jgi:hypothetical protein